MQAYPTLGVHVLACNCRYCLLPLSFASSKISSRAIGASSLYQLLLSLCDLYIKYEWPTVLLTMDGRTAYFSWVASISSLYYYYYYSVDFCFLFIISVITIL